MHRYTLSHLRTGLSEGSIYQAATAAGAYLAYLADGGTVAADDLHIDRMGLVGCSGASETPRDITSDWMSETG